MIAAGVDIGSRAVKLVLVGDGEVRLRRAADTGSDPLAVCRQLLADVACDAITATGYGRHLFRAHWPAAAVISEIKAVARGAVALVPGCRTVVDIGGQDSKVIAVAPTGHALKSAMNDRCAAGSGQFLETMATSLAWSPDEFAAAALRAERAERLNSTCAVFAQSEVVSQVARGARREEIARGVHAAVAARTAALATGVPVEDVVVFTGGGARYPALPPLLGAALRRELRVPDEPQFVAALGCALTAAAASAG